MNDTKGMTDARVTVLIELTEYMIDKNREARAEAYCSLDIGCGVYGICYAEKNNDPAMCPKTFRIDNPSKA
jgi:hypothetical protein